MKKMIFAAVLLFSCFAFKADAQFKINFNLNVGSQPNWGPTGYDHAEFYYMPDIDVYYNVPAHQYVYNDRGAWVTASALPPRYASFNLYTGYKVVLNQPEPWKNAVAIRAKYGQFKGRHDQGVIRDSRDDKYRNHWHGDENERGHRQDDHRDDHGRPDRGNGNN